MAVTALEVQIDQDRERVDLARFTKMLDRFATSLREIDRSYDAQGPRSVWVVRGLGGEGQRLTVQVTARPVQGRDDVSLLVPIEAFVQGVRLLEQEPELPQFYNERTVTRLLKIGEPQRGVREVAVATVNGVVGQSVDLSSTVMRHAREAVHPADVAVGTVTGKLDILNARLARRVRLSLFDSHSRRAVSGDAPGSMFDEIRAALGHRVAATGRITRNERGQAVRISVDALDLLPDSDEGRPSTEALLGIDPGWTHGLSVDEYLRGARRA